MKDEINCTELENLTRFLIALGDDSVIYSHRLSEWCSNGPYLEEDIALTNVALDYTGRARLFYQYAAKLEDNGKTEDDIAYLRTEREFTNLLIHELPINDFAFTMLRQYFMDVFYCLYLQALSGSKDESLSAIATKALKESHYHLKRSEPWIKLLAQGTDESRQRILRAQAELENFTGELFLMETWEVQLVDQGIAVDRSLIQLEWERQVSAFLAESNIQFTQTQLQVSGGRCGIHTEHLGHLLSEMQYLQRTYPGMKW